MNNNSSSDVVKRRITRGSEKKKKEEEDLKKKTKIRNVVRTRLEVKKMRSLEEMRLRSEDVGLISIFNDDDDSIIVIHQWKCLRMRSYYVSNNLLEPISCVIWVQTI